MSALRHMCTFCIWILTDKIDTLSTLPAVFWHKLCIMGYLPPQTMNWSAVQDLKYSETKSCLASWLSWGLQFGILLKATPYVAPKFFLCRLLLPIGKVFGQMNIVSKIRQLSEDQISRQLWHAGESSAFSSVVFLQNGHIPHKKWIVFLSLGGSDFSLLKHINLWIFPILQKPLCTAVQLEP